MLPQIVGAAQLLLTGERFRGWFGWCGHGRFSDIIFTHWLCIITHRWQCITVWFQTLRVC